MCTKAFKLERYQHLNETAEKGKIVFAGSSLMEMFPIEEFLREEHLDVVAYNRGVGGFVTKELLDNLDTCIIDLAPSKLFINIGTNDLSDPNRSIPEIIETYEAILKAVQKKVPHVRIYLMAYYPVNYDAATDEMKKCLQIRSNAKIRCANEAVKRLAQRYGVRYIDVNAPLLDSGGNLKAEYTIEGLHINEHGYRAIYPLLRSYITLECIE